MIEYGKMRYNLLGNGGHWFPGYRADKLEGMDLSNAFPMSPHAAQLPQVLREAHEMLKGEEVKRLSTS
jgi:predicted aldo/keto reductase-like oxidoreductase